MSELGSKKLCLKLFTLGTLVTCLVTLSHRENLARYGNAVQIATVPVITVREQPDAPLRISVLSYNSTDPRTPEITYELTNLSSKAIRAYAVRQETLRGTEKSRGSVLSDLDSTNAILQPGQYSTESITYQPLSEVASRVTLSLDFVEFADGETWGPNLHKSLELLEGRRAGVNEAGKHILEVYESGGIKGAIKAIEEDAARIAPPSDKPPEWREGFRHGISFISGRLKRALERGGMSQVEVELRRLSKKPKGGS